MSTGETIVDDGEFYIELNVNYAPSAAPGFLQRRCGYSATTPSGFECVGSFQKAPDGTWSADVTAAASDEDDCDCFFVGKSVSRMDAIAALWRSRHLAFCAHR